MTTFITATHPDYDIERTGYNLAVPHRPSRIVAARDVGDVIAAVRYAADHDLPVAVLATGHGPARSADDAMLINTSRMTDLTIDAGTRRARVGAGVRGGALVAAAAAHGLAPLNGSSPDVGVVSYHLGGGVGMMGRGLGWAVDHVRALEIVTPDGALQRVTPTENPDLFWALRGAGRAAFGVVVSLEIDLHPVRRIHGGGMHFVGDDIPRALHAYVDWTSTAPEAMGSSVLLFRMPDFRGVPAPLRNRFVAHLRFAFTGPAKEGERIVQPFRALHPKTDSVTEIPYSAIGSIHAEPTTPVAFHGRNTMLRGLDHTAASTLLQHAEHGNFLVELRHLGGAFGRPGAVPSALARRDGRFVLYAGGSGDRSTVAPELEALLTAMSPWNTGGTCISFLSGPDVSAETLASGYLPEDVARLARLKQQIDPANMFRFHHGAQ